MKRTENYIIEYEGKSLEPYSHIRGFDKTKDRITKFLQNQCLQLEIDANNRSGKFIWAENGAQCIITSEFNSSSSGVRRYVRIQIMPPSAELPRELSDFLVQDGFKKLE